MKTKRKGLTEKLVLPFFLLYTLISPSNNLFSTKEVNLQKEMKSPITKNLKEENKKIPYNLLPKDFRNKIKDYKKNYTAKSSYFFTEGKAIYWIIEWDVDFPPDLMDVAETYKVVYYEIINGEEIKKLYQYDENKPPEPWIIEFNWHQDARTTFDEIMIDEKSNGVEKKIVGNADEYWKEKPNPINFNKKPL